MRYRLVLGQEFVSRHLVVGVVGVVVVEFVVLVEIAWLNPPHIPPFVVDRAIPSRCTMFPV